MKETAIKEEVWDVLRDDPEHGLQIRVVSWNDREPVIEKRYVLRAKDGTTKTGRCKGFDFTDFLFLVQNEKRIRDLFERGDKTR